MDNVEEELSNPFDLANDFGADKRVSSFKETRLK